MTARPLNAGVTNLNAPPTACIRCCRAFGKGNVHRSRRLCSICHRWATKNGVLEEYSTVTETPRNGPRLPTRDPSTHWMDSANCVSINDPDKFFPTSGMHRMSIVEAVLVCRSCPVIAECEDRRRRIEETNPGWARGVWAGKFHPYMGRGDR